MTVPATADSLDLKRAVALLNDLADDRAAWANDRFLSEANRQQHLADAALLRLLAERLPELLEADMILRKGW